MSDAHLKRHPFLFYFLQNKRSVLIGLSAVLATNILDALPPLFIGIAIDQMTNGKPFSEILETIGIIFAITAGIAGFRFIWRIYWGRFHHSAAADLRNRIFNKFSILGQSFFQKNPVGDLMSLINNDVNSFRMAIGPGILLLFDALFIFIVTPPIMWSISPEWTWKTLILLPVVPFLIAKIIKLIHTNYRVQQNRFGEVSSSAQEIIAGIRVIKSYAQEQNRTRLFNIFSRKYELACNDVAKVDAFFTPVMELGVTSGAVILLLIGAPQVMAGHITIGAFFAFYQYIQRMIWPATALGISISFFQQGRASFDRILNLLNEPISIPDTGTSDDSVFQTLKVTNLSYTYPNQVRPVLKNVNFEIQRGEILGIVGPTGSGKSSLVELLCRVYEVQPGQIQINGKDISDFQQKSFRQLVSFVPQEAFLFSQKISDNIALGGESSINDIEKMTELVNLKNEIHNIPDQLDAYLGERGVNLSGGQKQRLTIARALIRRSPLVILDDSLSAVDAKTEKSILSQLQGHLDGHQDTTAIIVSHRLASLKFATKILVLNDGDVEALGTHDELLTTSATYKKLYHLQEKGVRYEQELS